MSASTNLGGKNFTYTSESINFFDALAFRSGEYWDVNWVLDDIIVEILPEYDLLRNIQLCINSHVADGDGDKIRMLLVAPCVGAALYMLNEITPEHLKNAQEHDGYIDIPNVKICDCVLTVRVVEDPECRFATADANGVIV